MANIYDKVPIKVQKKSGFDKSFQNLFTGKVGTVIPILTDELIPNTTVDLRMAISTQLPPLASDTFMRVKQKYAAFFVPTRILVPGYEKWLTNSERESSGSTSTGKVLMPTFQFKGNTNKAIYAPGTLLDYLGFKCNALTGGTTDANIELSALPMLAYHKIWNDWFRNTLVQNDIFEDVMDYQSKGYSAGTSNTIIPNSLAVANYRMTFGSGASGTAGSSRFADGIDLSDLRQANFGSDIYTSCTPQPQNGDAQSVSFAIPESAGDDGSFTISALRAANSMQQFLERNNLAGNRLVDYVKAQYGANLSDAIAQRPILIGSGSFDVYSKGIYQTATQVENESITSTNPFGSVGTRYGSAYVDGQDLVVKGFTAHEPGYLMVVTWLSPKVTYSTGVDPMLKRYIGRSKQSDMANPILQNVGNEPIYAWQLSGTQALVGNSSVFGYNERYCNWKDKTDEVHGILRDGQSLQSFALQRTFDSIPQINTGFLTIPTTYLDQVSAVDGDVSKFGYWCDTYFDYKVSMPLARYSVPSLQDPAYEHGEDVVIDRSGKQLS